MKTLLSHVLTLASFVAIITTGNQLSAQTVVNGSFESGTNPGNSLLVSTGDSTTIFGWTVATGTVDYIGTRWGAAQGTRSIDLAGQSAGTLSQTISGFTVGLTYRLTFSMAANTEFAPVIKSLQADAGSTSQVFTFDGTGHSGASMGWSTRTMDFLANSSTLTLSFTSLQNGSAGPALDAVSIAAVPEPTNIAFVGALIFGARCLKRRLTQSKKA